PSLSLFETFPELKTPGGPMENIRVRSNGEKAVRLSPLPHDHAHEGGHAHGPHGHTHEHWDNPGEYRLRELAMPDRDYTRRAFTIGIGGPVGSGKTALTLALCRHLRDNYSLGVVTNDIFTKEDGEFLTRNHALEANRITAVETGGCP